jgi:hypothetical protein
MQDVQELQDNLVPTRLLQGLTRFTKELLYVTQETEVDLITKTSGNYSLWEQEQIMMYA